MICVPIIAKNAEEAYRKILRANLIADLLEFRLDMMESFRLDHMVQMASKPVIATYRSRKEGGKGVADYKNRARYLLNAIEAGAEYVDLEYSMPQKMKQKFFQMSRTFKVIVSTHMVSGTPSLETLERTLKKMVVTGADIVKIVSWARTPQDNLRILGLIPMAQKLDVRIIAFCMGAIGRISRIASPLIGGYMTFASLEEGEESADGQIPITEMKKILGMLES